MHNYFNSITIKSIYAFVGVVLLYVFFTTNAFCQSFGDPIINVTFGAGTATYAPPLSPTVGYTTYNYVSRSPENGEYTIVNTSSVRTDGAWVVTNDHTGDAGGYFMMINAGVAPGTFYTKTISGLCGGTIYEFGAWIKNLLSRSSGIPPNITFSIEAVDGTVLRSGNTGDIQNGTNQWVQYAFNFTTPNNTGDLVLKMTNNAPGGAGNDLILDDITFRPEGATVAVTFDQAEKIKFLCEGTSETLHINAATPPPANHLYKLQQQVNGAAWTDVGIPGTTTGFNVSSPIAAGIYKYRVALGRTDNISASQCIVASNELVLNVVQLPTAIISSVDDGCAGVGIAFRDSSKAYGSTLLTWLWEFGDGQTSTQQNPPAHLYAAAGNYMVKLTVTNSNGCVPRSTTKVVRIKNQPIAAFSYSTFSCAGKEIIFTNNSTPAADVVSCEWNFGDGSPKETRAANQPVRHTYPTVGAYPVTLIITTAGCTQAITKTITVNPIPVANFTVPGVCVNDVSAKFFDNSTIADGTANGFTYSWDFGDAGNLLNPNTSSNKDPAHKYRAVGDYLVTLIVTSVNGCSDTIVKKVTVNGATPKADFTLPNGPNLCSDNELVVASNATVVEFGSVTKVIMYYDYDGDRNIMETDSNPSPGKMYRHIYPEFHAANGLPKRYNVRMIAYSGQLCFQLSPDNYINVYPTPVLAVTPLADICYNAGPLLLNSVRETTGIAGQGVYSGKGVSQGRFDPVAAGLGKISIRYTYTTLNNCIKTIDQDIMVKPAPTVNAGNDVMILEGGTAILNATAQGNGLTYAWLPTTGLSNPNIANPVVTGTNKDIVYRVTVTNTEGCSEYDDILVSTLKIPVIPNTFTPNGDGINDTWEIKYLNTYTNGTIDIFNRYGQKVFSSIGYPKPWDGRTNGSDLPAGVYYYLINPQQGRKAFSGYITIIR